MKLPFFWIDAFTSSPLEGNACGVVLDADDLGAETMQSIAREMNLSETAFVLRSDTADFGARYFTPAEEIPLAGHPTISVTRALLDSGRLVADGPTTFTLGLRDGPIEVAIEPAPRGAARITMAQRRPEFLALPEPAGVAAAFGLRAADLHPEAPPQVVSTGTPQLMVPVRSRDVLGRARMDVPAYLALKASAGFFSPHLFAVEGFTTEGDTYARHFGVPPDTAEDPFTGSATGGMAAFLWRYGLIRKRELVAEQGHDMGRPGRGFVRIEGPPGQPERIHVGGEAVTVARGTISVPD